jgi:hypothetical protein
LTADTTSPPRFTSRQRLILPAAGFTLLFGRLADLFGRRRLFLAGMVLLDGRRVQ